MRIGFVIVTSSLLLLAGWWYFASSEFEPRQGHSAGQELKRPGRVAQLSSDAFPTPDLSKLDTSRIIAMPTPDAPAAPRSPLPFRAGEMPTPADNVKEGPDARIGAGGAAPSQRQAPTPQVAAQDEPLETERGKLTFQGSYTYKPQGNPPPSARGTVSISGTLDCKDAIGSVYYRDSVGRVEWQSSRFAFDAKSVCVTNRQELESLVTRFDASIEGTYSPSSLDEHTEALGGGVFALRLNSTDLAGSPMPSVRLCLVLQGGAYGQYALPQNAATPSPMPGCTFLDSFTAKRTKKTS